MSKQLSQANNKTKQSSKLNRKQTQHNQTKAHSQTLFQILKYPNNQSSLNNQTVQTIQTATITTNSKQQTQTKINNPPTSKQYRISNKTKTFDKSKLASTKQNQGIKTNNINKTRIS